MVARVIRPSLIMNSCSHSAVWGPLQLDRDAPHNTAGHARHTYMAARGAERSHDDRESIEASSLDPLDQLLADYTFTCHPETRIKLKQR